MYLQLLEIPTTNTNLLEIYAKNIYKISYYYVILFLKTVVPWNTNNYNNLKKSSIISNPIPTNRPDPGTDPGLALGFAQGFALEFQPELFRYLKRGDDPLAGKNFFWVVGFVLLSVFSGGGLCSFFCFVCVCYFVVYCLR